MQHISLSFIPLGGDAAEPVARSDTTIVMHNEVAAMNVSFKKMMPVLLAAFLLFGGYGIWASLRVQGPGEGFGGGNGRIEATEIDIATKLAGRIEKILVSEGDFVTQGQTLAVMQIYTLEAQRNEAIAQHQQAITAEISAKAQIALRESDIDAAEAFVAQRASELDSIQRRLARSSTLSKKGAVSIQEFDDDETRMHGAKAALIAAEAQVAVARAAVESAKAEATGTAASVKAAEATIARIQADIDDSTLKAPRSGRIQYRIAQPGEVLAAGGKLLNLVDLSDVYMTFFLPETAVGKVSLGSDARIILDAAPQYVIPAKVSFVASTAQFTPKTVETASERQKLMFRVKAQIDTELLQKYLQQVKTGLPGMAWVKLDPQAEWPAELVVKVPQ